MTWWQRLARLVKEAYPGIDLVFHSRRGVVEFDFELAAGADPSRARFTFPGRAPALLPDGTIRVTTAAGDLVLVHLPPGAMTLAAQRGYLPASVPSRSSTTAVLW